MNELTPENFLSEYTDRIHKEFPHCMVIHKDVVIQSQNKDIPDSSLRIAAIENLNEGCFHAAVIMQQVVDHFFSVLPSLIHEIQALRKGLSIQTYNQILGKEILDNKNAIFSGHTYLYVPEKPRGWIEAIEIYKESGIRLLLRDNIYWDKLKALNKKEVFLCHDTKDQDFVEVLANELIMKGISPWLDKMCIKLGDSIMDKINEGLKSCNYGVVILSPTFVENKGWARREFKSLVLLSLYAQSKKIKKKCIIPVWRGIGSQEILDYDPEFLDICAEIVSPPPAININEIKKLASNIASLIRK